MKVQNCLRVLGVCWMLALGGSIGFAAPQSVAEHAEEGHVHPDKGPHGGDLIELGDEEYHAEVVHDEANGQIAIYLLDGSATKLVAIPATHVVINLVASGKARQFKLMASPEVSDKLGCSSKFMIKDEVLGDYLHSETCKATLVAIIGGKQYRGAILHSHGS